MRVRLLMHGWSGQGISGGDKHLVDLAHHWQGEKGISLSLSLPVSGRKILAENFAGSLKGIELKTLSEFFPQEKLVSFGDFFFHYGQRTLLSIFDLIFSPPFDVVVSASHFFYDVGPSFVSALLKKSLPVLYVYHLVSFQRDGWDRRRHWSAFLERLSLRLARRVGALVFTVNPETYAQLRLLGFDPQHLHLTSIAVERTSVPADDYRRDYDVVYLGRLAKTKGLVDLVEALAGARRRKSDLRALIIGSGEEESRLRSLVAQKNLQENVVFAGFVNEEKKAELLRRGRLFVSLSYEEGWAIALAEAMAIGLPAVVYDLPVYRAVFGDAPVVVPRGDSAAAAESILKLLNDPDFFRAKAAAARRVVVKYFSDAVAQRDLSVMTEVLDARS